MIDPSERPTSLSTTPSSLQVMLNLLSPAVGTPGTMTRGVKRALVSPLEE